MADGCGTGKVSGEKGSFVPDELIYVLYSNFIAKCKMDLVG